MSRRGFLQAIFALADVWVREYSVSEYVKFLQSKWHRVRDLHRQGVAARHIGKGTDPLIGAGMMVHPPPRVTLCAHTRAHTHAQRRSGFLHFADRSQETTFKNLVSVTSMHYIHGEATPPKPPPILSHSPSPPSRSPPPATKKLSPYAGGRPSPSPERRLNGRHSASPPPPTGWNEALQMQQQKRATAEPLLARSPVRTSPSRTEVRKLYGRVDPVLSKLNELPIATLPPLVDPSLKPKYQRRLKLLRYDDVPDEENDESTWGSIDAPLGPKVGSFEAYRMANMNQVKYRPSSKQLRVAHEVITRPRTHLQTALSRPASFRKRGEHAPPACSRTATVLVVQRGHCGESLVADCG